jgi:tRNA threonylcarbamoyladenosine biosynthesis protein TsaE
MGAGKTTIINSLLQHLGITDFQGSPTFAIVQSYLIPTNENCYHIDAYRIKNKEEGLAIGFDEIMNEEAYFFIEWPEKIESFLPDNTIWVYIRESESNKRIIQIEE